MVCEIQQYLKNVSIHCNIAFRENSISMILQNSLHYYILFIITCNMVNKINVLFQNVSILFLIDCTLLLSRSNSFIHVPKRYLISLTSLYLLVCDYVENSFLIIIDTRVIVLVKHLSCIHPLRRSVKIFHETVFIFRCDENIY